MQISELSSGLGKTLETQEDVNAEVRWLSGMHRAAFALIAVVVPVWLLSRRRR